VNHLGHFALTGLLLDRLVAVPGSRVVTVTSGLHRWARLDAADPARPGRRRSLAAYARSKLANVVFTLELQRRLVLAGAPSASVGAHPGLTRTGLARTMPWPLRGGWGLARPLSQSAAQGALAVLRAAVDPDVSGGDLLGPSGPMELTGAPTWVLPAPRALDVEVQRTLWETSERLTGVRWPRP
jgi:NAD(P)-dependent dehydrogenase (short-subunit alcohol dehydrogenase family)